MTLERITEMNIDYAIQIQEELFPGESGRANFVESMDERSGYEYFLLYEDGTGGRNRVPFRKSYISIKTP